MILLRWKATMGFGPWARAALGSQRLVFVVWTAVASLVGLVVAWWADLRLALEIGLTLLLFPFVLVLLGVAANLRRLRTVHQTRRPEQWYTLTPDAVEIVLGRDRMSIPVGELRVVSQGADWVATVRRGMGRRECLFFADDRDLVAQVVALVTTYGDRSHGAGTR